MFTIALPKGRILESILPLLKKIQFINDSSLDNGRALIHKSLFKNWQIIVVRAYDIPVFIEHGSADIGITGKDVLLELDESNYYEMIDLNIAKCKLMTAGIKGQDLSHKTNLKVASKFHKVTKKYFSSIGKQVEVIKLNGAMELAPIMGMADLIVDIVDTGNTLKSNGLEQLDLITNISSRLIVNKASLKLHYAEINDLVNKIKSVV
jgi:ATP phosphoribosyltransferase